MRQVERASQDVKHVKDNKAFERATGIFLGAEAGRCEESAALREVHNHIRTEERLYSMGKDLHKNFRMVSNLICVEKIHSVFSGEGKVWKRKDMKQGDQNGLMTTVQVREDESL